MKPVEFEAKVVEIIQRTHNVKSVRLSVPRGADYEPGQFLCASLNAPVECKRYLSISSSPTEKGYVEFTKKITQSDFSATLGALKKGDTVRLRYPFGNFTLKDPSEKICFLSGGIDITPIRSICKFAVDKNLGTDIVLIYANRTQEDIVFRKDFEQMQEKYPKLKVVHVLQEAAPGFKARIGLISSQVIREEVPDYNERKFFICGPPMMVDAMKKILSVDLSLPKDRVITENFTGY